MEGGHRRPPLELTLALDLAGTFVFALSGGIAARSHRLDAFGVFVVALAAGTAGGVARDVLVGDTPPLAVRDWRYLAVAVLASIAVLLWQRGIGRASTLLIVLDAAGLGLFSVTGTLKALSLGVEPAGAVLLGVMTGIGGGIARDLLVGEVPLVLRRDVYALAALAGATAAALGQRAGFSPDVVAPVAAALCFAVRLIAWRRRWQLPTT